MKKPHFWIVIIFLCSEMSAFGQLGIGLQAGFLQSIPLAKRDSFSGAPMPMAAINFYIPYKPKIGFIAGLNYMPVRLVNDFDASSIKWETLSLSIGAEWKPGKSEKTTIKTCLHGNYMLSYGKNILSSNTSSGTTFVEGSLNQTFIPAFELGLSFNPRPFVFLNMALVQPINVSSNKDPYAFPGMFKLALEYRINTKQIGELRRDTFNAEKNFAMRLKVGTLYVIEDQSDSANQVIKQMFTSAYNFSKVEFVSSANLKSKLESLSASEDQYLHYVAKLGNIVYETGRPATYGLIVYNIKMEDPIPDNPFYIRDLNGDVAFENPSAVKKVVSSLNSKLYKLYSMYSK